MPPRLESEVAVVRARLTAQLVAGKPARSATDVVNRVLAVQAQDARGFRLAVRSRSTGVDATDVDDALRERALLVTWLNRGTLHLVSADDYWWLHPLTTPQLTTGNQRRLRQEGVSERQAEQGITVVIDAVNRGPQTRDGLRAMLTAAGVPTAGQAFIHVLVAASVQGHIVRGPMIDNHHAFVSVADWLGPPPPPLDRDEALALLARRYLAGHGPAAPPDLAKWSGVTLRDAKRGFAAIVAEVVPARDGADGQDDLVDLADRDAAAPLPSPRLLGPFDPILHGWQSRASFVGSHAGVVTTNGLFRPVALVGGRVVGTWGLANGVVSVKLLEPITPSVRNALVDDAAAVLRYLGLPSTPAVIGGDTAASFLAPHMARDAAIAQDNPRA